MSICNYENLTSSALKRAIRLGEGEAGARGSATWGPWWHSTSGKIELETLGETERGQGARHSSCSAPILNVFNRRFKAAELEEVVKGFEGGLRIDASDSMPAADSVRQLAPGEGARRPR